MRTVMPELVDKVEVKGECLVWTGWKCDEGYGRKQMGQEDI